MSIPFNDLISALRRAHLYLMAGSPGEPDNNLLTYAELEALRDTDCGALTESELEEVLASTNALRK